MQVERTIANIAQNLREGRFPNEQSISQGIVLRILSDLGWDVYDTNSVWPEYSTGEGRVDFALCAPPEKPKCFVEVKQQGRAEDGVKQARIRLSYGRAVCHPNRRTNMELLSASRARHL